MKLLLLLLMFAPVESFGQEADNTNRFDEKNIYYEALVQYLNYSRLDSDTIYLENDYRFADSLLLQSGPTKFIKLNWQEKSQLLKIKKSFTIYRIYPLEFREKEFSISIVPFMVTKGKNKRNINYANTGGYRIVFSFENNKFIFLRFD